MRKVSELDEADMRSFSFATYTPRVFIKAIKITKPYYIKYKNKTLYIDNAYLVLDKNDEPFIMSIEDFEKNYRRI